MMLLFAFGNTRVAIPRICFALSLVAALAATIRPAFADQQYRTTGEDLYRVGPAPVVSRVTYDGTQRLTVEHAGKGLRYDAQARYTRDNGETNSIVDARFVQVALPGGSFRDRLDDDPDFLTILNQPFAVQLDANTLRDVKELRGKVPFAATSPLGGEQTLRGYLRPAAPGKIDGRLAAGVRFEAEGPMSGALPDRAGTIVDGRMRMEGTAYYAADDALLLALDARLTIVAKLQDNGRTLPVRIVYRRSIRATKTPPPARPAADGGTASPATP